MALSQAAAYCVIDVDCTLYSYAELLRENRRYPRDLLDAFLWRHKAGQFPAVDRLWRRIEEQIIARLELIRQLAGEQVIYLSAFPLEGPKLQTFNDLKILAESTYPVSKVDWQPHGFSARMVFGDRAADLELARRLRVPWGGFPFWSRKQRLEGVDYTRALLDELRLLLARTSETAETPC